MTRTTFLFPPPPPKICFGGVCYYRNNILFRYPGGGGKTLPPGVGGDTPKTALPRVPLTPGSWDPGVQGRHPQNRGSGVGYVDFRPRKAGIRKHQFYHPGASGRRNRNPSLCASGFIFRRNNPFLFAQFHPARPYICLMVLISTQQIRAIESTKTGVVHYEYKSLETQKKPYD